MTNTYKIFGKLISWVFPTKKLRNQFRHVCQEADSIKKYKIIRKNQQNVLANLKNEAKNRKLKVVFLCAENQKWAYQSLYEEFEKSPFFDVQILLTLKDNFNKKKYKNFKIKQTVTENFNFFNERNMNVDCAFDLKRNKHLKLDVFKPDIIFYEQPWGLHKLQSPLICSKFALTCYSSYGSCITNGENEYSEPFFREQWAYFVDNPYIKNVLTQEGSVPESVVVSGHLKLDNYLKEVSKSKDIWPSDNKTKIIYAPHHSFYKGSTLGFGTFSWNYDYFLSLVKNHPEIDFILKPHPQLKLQIVKRNLMTFEEMTAYFDEWDKLPNAKICNEGNYFDIFRTSDCMITDCNSFLFEYLPTLNPVIHLISENSVGHNLYGEKISSGYYKAHSIQEMQNIIEDVILNKKDSLKETREKTLKELVRPEGGTAAFIKDYILEKIGGK